LGTETLQQVFRNARWTFQSDGHFSFDPPPEADVRRDFFPISGDYSRNGNTFQFQAERQGSSTSRVSVDGSIQMGTTTAKVDLIYSASAGHTQRVVRVSQTLTEASQAVPTRTARIAEITVPSVFNISLRGATDTGPFGPLPGVLKILPTTYATDPNPFFVSIQTDSQQSYGNLFWTSYAPPQAQVGRGDLYSTVHTNGNQVRLHLNPTKAARQDVSWFTGEPGTLGAILGNAPIGTQTAQSGSVTFTIQGKQVTGEIEAAGTTWFGRPTTYRAQFTGQFVR
jgi:hypothetical protein